jgi:acyl-CoA-dependent ceramide synthase
MDALYLTKWLPSYLEPFISLSYPTNTPKDPDSFPHAPYYNTGRRDLCFIITCIVVMAVLRDTLRLGVFEPFARWKLSRDLKLRKKQKSLRAVANGTANNQAKRVSSGNGHAANGSLHPSAHELRQVHRSVLRFAEQGWSVVYYTLQWSLGLVCRPFPGFRVD